MDKKARAAFNDSFNTAKYRQMLKEIDLEFPGELDFRVAESPVLVPKEFKTKLLLTCNQIIDVIQGADFKEKTQNAIPENYLFENEGEHPEFLCIDFAVSKDSDGNLAPQLIELQGFPSLFAYQSYLSGKYKKYFSTPANYSPYFNRLNAFSYSNEMKKLLKGEDSTKNTILLEVFPEKQKTRLDFELSKKYWDIDVVCLSKVYEENGSLFYIKEGQKKKIDRIYNRIIFDEIDQKYPEMKSQIDILKTAKVEWIANPNWFYRISKYILPYLKGSYIPECHYLHELKNLPENLNEFVLKPLFSFAGAGVQLDLTAEMLENIENKQNYLLQKKVEYVPFLVNPEGNEIKAEIRMMYIWPKGKKRPTLVTNLARLSRGKMIGVDFNKDFDWVGGSACFFETD